MLPQRWNSTPCQDKVGQLYQRALPPREHNLEKRTGESIKANRGLDASRQGASKFRRCERTAKKPLPLEEEQRSANLLMISAWKYESNWLEDRTPTYMKCWRHCSRKSCPWGQRTQCVWSRRDWLCQKMWRTALAAARGFTRERLATRSCHWDQNEFWQLHTVWWKWVRTAQKRLRSRGSWVRLVSRDAPLRATHASKHSDVHQAGCLRRVLTLRGCMMSENGEQTVEDVFHSRGLVGLSGQWSAEQGVQSRTPLKQSMHGVHGGRSVPNP